MFRDRVEAGRLLAEALRKYADRADVIVLALPRGGVPVAYQVASSLNVPLDVFVVRKLGVPGHEELAMGALASGGTKVLNAEVVRALGLRDDVIEAVASRAQRELERRERLYRGEAPQPEIRGQTVILVDDGLATGSTMRAAIAALRRRWPARIVVAVPVGSPATCAELERLVDEVICLETPLWFVAVGQWYDDFTQTSDEQVREYLDRARRRFERAA